MMKVTVVSVPFAGVPEIQRNLVEAAVHLRQALAHAKTHGIDSQYDNLKAPFVRKTLAALNDPALDTFMDNARQNLAHKILVRGDKRNQNHTVQTALGKSHPPAAFVRHVADVARQQAQPAFEFIGQNGEKLLNALLPPKKPQPASIVPTTTEAVSVR